MEVLSESDGSSSEFQLSDDDDIDDLFLPNLDPENPLPTEDSQNECQEELGNVLAGNISVTDYEKIIREKSAPVNRIRPSGLRSLIGQANLSYVRGQHDETLRLCKEAICLAPDAPEPYETMSELYEDLGDFEKSLKLGIVAGAMKRDADYWITIGNKALSLEKPEDALLCYSKAVKIQPSLSQIQKSIISLCDPKRDKKLIIFRYNKLVQHAPVEEGREILENAQAGAQLLLEDPDEEGALAIMELAFSRVPEHVKFGDVNLIAELYIGLKKYEETLQVIARYCDVVIEAEDILVAESSSSEVTNMLFRVINCNITGEIPHQIRAKLIIALVHLKAFHLIDLIVKPILEELEEYGDLLIDIIEVFMAEGRQSDALPLLKSLIQSQNFAQTQVWLHYAECLRKLNKKEEAVSAYLVVLEKAPQLTEAKLVVSEILNDLGREDEAISALTQDPTSECLDVGMLFERCQLLKDNPARSQEFLAIGRLFLSRHCTRIRNSKEYLNFLRSSKRIREISKRTFDADPEEPVYVEGKRMPTAEEEYELFRKLCNTAFVTKQYALLQRLTCTALGSKVLCRTPQMELETHALAALASFFNGDVLAGHCFFKQLNLQGFDSKHFWNIYNIVLNSSEDVRLQKYIMRLLNKYPNHMAFPLMFANKCFSSGTYKQALCEYLLQLKNEPHPLLALLVSITCLQLSLQKHSKSTTNTNTLITQAVGHMSQYRQLRGEECAQEVHYNLGRLHHQLNLLPTALYHYKQVLEIPPPCEMFDLKREAAYNISRIYQASKSYELARYYVHKYIVV